MKKRNRLASFRRRQRDGKSMSPRRNPPIDVDLKEYIVPGFAAYAGTRFLTRIVHSLASKRFPKGGTHLSVLSAGAAFGAAWLLAHRFKATERYHTPVVVGSAIAAIQTAIQAYVPRYGWMVGDVIGVKEAHAAPAPAALPPALPSGSGGSSRIAEDEDLPGGMGSLGSLGSGGLSDADLDALVAEYE